MTTEYTSFNSYSIIRLPLHKAASLNEDQVLSHKERLITLHAGVQV